MIGGRSEHVFRHVILIALGTLAAFVPRAPAAPAYHGMSYTSFGQDALATAGSDQSLANMSIVGVDTVAINFWWFQDTISSNSMSEDFSSYSSTISSVEHAIDTAHSLGMKVLLKPMLDVKDGTWRAYINPNDKDQWFANYTNFLGTFADVAQTKGVELFSIGCEMNTMELPANNSRWHSLIDNMNSRYDGQLTYSANWGSIENSVGGYANVPWWDQLDYIGIDAYFPISTVNNPTPAQLASSTSALADNIESWRNANYPAKNVLFTEIGYRSLDGATRAPWGESVGSGAVDLQEQADAYNAVLNTFSARSWWDGAFWWSWETNPYSGGAADDNFTPQNKPAQSVLASHYGGTTPPPLPTGSPTQTFFSWETGVEGWQVPGFHGKPASNQQSTTGATAGSHSLAITQTGDNFSWDSFVTLTGDVLSAFSLAVANDPANYQIEFDVTYNTAFIPQSSVTFLKNSVAINTAAGSWSQVDDVANTNGRTNQTIHVAISLSDFSALTPGSSSYSIFIALNGNWGTGSATVFYDNFRLVNLNAPLPGDYNGDGRVDAVDYTIWRDHLGSNDYPQADGNLNGQVDVGDYQIWKANFGAVGGSGSGGLAVAVPEPNSLALGLVAVIFAFFCIRLEKNCGIGYHRV